jgi:hypothetical protein
MPEQALKPSGPVRDLLRRFPVLDIDLPGFEPGRVPADPVTLFSEWLAAAVTVGVSEPQSMSLATADADGRPSSRVLICKDVEPRASGSSFQQHRWPDPHLLRSRPRRRHSRGHFQGTPRRRQQPALLPGSPGQQRQPHPPVRPDTGPVGHRRGRCLPPRSTSPCSSPGAVASSASPAASHTTPRVGRPPRPAPSALGPSRPGADVRTAAVLDVARLGGADDRGGHRRIVQQPGERDARGRDAVCLGDLGHPLGHVEVGNGGVLRARQWIGIAPASW